MVPLVILSMDKLIFMQPLMGQVSHTPVPVDTYLMVPAQEHVIMELGQEWHLCVYIDVCEISNIFCHFI